MLVSKAARLHEIDVDRVAGGRQEMMERSGRRTVPQIWIGPHHVGGCDELFALERAGKLDALLAG
ncbi:Glutaredoxin 3 (Grx3) [Alloalcanivorax xenomutans]|nr:Glutaredoxin 3 (Grx3) [Alloalcanivorax xenomutans]